jgi:hypothetical protein
MSKNELLMRERLSATGARVSKSETAQTTRVLWDDELDAVSGGSSEEPHESCSFNFLRFANASGT